MILVHLLAMQHQGIFNVGWIDSLFPFCRGHSEAGTADHEPWSFGEEVGSTLAVQG